MSECWQEGDLRAWMDRELPTEEMDRAAAHVTECAECRALYHQLAARAARVAVWMDDLSETVPVGFVPRKAQRTRAWKWAMVGLAAALAVAIVELPRGTGPAKPAAPMVVSGVVPAAPAPSEAAPAPEITAPEVRQAAASRSALRVRRGKAQRTEQFIALDNEPFETGLVVRVALGPEEVQADVVFSPDGRARAYRLVSDNDARVRR